LLFITLLLLQYFETQKVIVTVVGSEEVTP